MHERPEPTPLGWPILPRHNQPFTPPIRPIKTSMRYTANQSLRLQLINASYVPGYFNHDIQRTPLRASYVPGCFTPGIQRHGTLRASG
jgi:hypothetical protein